MTEDEQNPEGETAETQEVAAGEPAEAPIPVGAAPTSPRTVTVQVRYLLATAAATGVLVLGLLVAVIVGAADSHGHGPPDFGGRAGAAYGTAPPMSGGPSAPTGPARPAGRPEPRRNAAEPVGPGLAVDPHSDRRRPTAAGSGLRAGARRGQVEPEPAATA